MKSFAALKLSALAFGALLATFAAPQAAQASSTLITCTPVQSMAYGTRIHVKCSASVGGIYYFAAPTSNPDNAARMLSTINAGLVSGRTLSIWYDPADLSGSSIGCSNSDCRLLQAVGIK